MVLKFFVERTARQCPLTALRNTSMQTYFRWFVDEIDALQDGCGECGGSGCSNRGGGLTGDDCCHSDILAAGNLCSVTGGAPCIIDGEFSVRILVQLAPLMFPGVAIFVASCQALFLYPHLNLKSSRGLRLSNKPRP